MSKIRSEGGLSKQGSEQGRAGGGRVWQSMPLRELE